jgi:glucosamine--fructose-6-phosphate aminotransferase (isomerizing)
MCGIVGAITNSNILSILIDGLKRLEYRGYDSSGIAIKNTDNSISCLRALGKVKELEKLVKTTNIQGNIGIAHTRWATHGKPAEKNAHPQMSDNSLALVHNGIIENFEVIKQQLQAEGIKFHSETDTESLVHLISKYQSHNPTLLASVTQALKQIEGAYAFYNG